MSCNKNLKNCHYKTAEAVYNPTSQALATGRNVLTLLGTKITDTGVGAAISGNDIVINVPGLYYIAADTNITATDAGAVDLQLALDGTLLPSTLRSTTAAAAAEVTLHTEEILYIPIACGGASPVVNVSVVTAAGGTATLTAVRLVKLA